jgi:surfactin synthase thioesterase subunit
MMGNSLYRPLYEPQIQTPVLHFTGEYDTIIPEKDTLKLVERCANAKTVRFVGGHFIPKDKASRAAVLDFITSNTKTRDVVADSGYASEVDTEREDKA